MDEMNGESVAESKGITGRNLPGNHRPALSVLKKGGRSFGAKNSFFLDATDPTDSASSGASSENWSVSWSDLMMTMFILFAVLYVYTAAGREDAFQSEAPLAVGYGERTPFGEASFGNAPFAEAPSTAAGGGPPAETLRLTPEQLFELSKQVVKEANLQDVEVTLADEKEMDVALTDKRAVKISVKGPLLFDLGSAQLREETKEFLQKLAQILQKTPNEVRVAGHTDNFPVHSSFFQTNWELSAIRATTVARYLMEQGNLNPARFTVIGHSFYKPVAPNTTRENKQNNRRVEIIITRESLPESLKDSNVQS